LCSGRATKPERLRAAFDRYSAEPDEPAAEVAEAG